MMVLKGWNLARLSVERMVNTMVLELWRYLYAICDTG